MRLAVLEILGIWALAIAGAYSYANHISQKYAASINVNSDLTELLQVRLSAVMVHADAYSVPVCIFMVLMFLIMRVRAQGSWLLTALLVCSSLLIFIITDTLMEYSVLDL